MSFEVWNKEKLGQAKGQPETFSATLDVAMLNAKKMSKGTKKVSIYDNKSNNYIDIVVPLLFAVVDRNGKQSRVRGYGVGGAWVDHKDCKRCKNSGTETQTWGEPCNACKGASWAPKV